jgi:hypothetical protein
MLETYDLLLILYWVLMVPVAVFIHYKVCGYFADDFPSSIWRGVVMVLFLAAAVFFTYDASGYFFFLGMQDPSIGIQLPPGFTYWDWLREPIALKWHVLGFAPIVRYIPLVIAVCVGCILQALLYMVPFRVAMVLFVAQLFLNYVALVALSFVFRAGIDIYERAANKRPEPAARTLPAEPDPRREPGSLAHLDARIDRLGPDRGPHVRRINADWEQFNRHLQPLYALLQPVTRHLSVPAQDFLNGGGWPLVLVGLGILGVFWPRIHRGRKHLHRHHHKHAAVPAAQHRDRLVLIGDAMTGLGARQVMVQGVPARLRLVVLAPTAAGGEPVSREVAPRVLDAIRPGLGEVAGVDCPRIETWNHPGPEAHFHRNFAEAVEVPEPKGAPSQWVRLSGEAPAGAATVHVGLALHTDKATTLGLIEVAPGKWAEVLDLRVVPEVERE